MFVILAVIMVLCSIATVVTKSVIRAATYLLFVLLGTAGMYFLMGYTFLGAVQTMVYAGGIIVLYVFAILLTEGAKEDPALRTVKDASWGFILTLVGFIVFIVVLLKQRLFDGIAALGAPTEPAGADAHNSIDEIGHYILSTGSDGYLLPFEAVSVLLLACIVAGLLIARKR